MHERLDFSDSTNPDLMLGNFNVWVKGYLQNISNTDYPMDYNILELQAASETEGVRILEPYLYLYVDQVKKFGLDLQGLAAGEELIPTLIMFDQNSLKERVTLEVLRIDGPQKSIFCINVEIVRKIGSEEYTMQFKLDAPKISVAVNCIEELVKKWPVRWEGASHL
ncbi:MAG TPA: hypothetical protein PK747_06070 [Acidobacteriota bacterium]|nr:hypothetical protein [Acidobacteriota bacterium]HNT18179.1 hypothetical protein [Acidobacteriota bacterium]HQO19914.1 hypothetical protein [Acidobacteriota bacterium]HQQ46961.1 hypothetical protein [Acidobacteriota bacterium]